MSLSVRLPLSPASIYYYVYMCVCLFFSLSLTFTVLPPQPSPFFLSKYLPRHSPPLSKCSEYEKDRRIRIIRVSSSAPLLPSLFPFLINRLTLYLSSSPSLLPIPLRFSLHSFPMFPLLPFTTILKPQQKYSCFFYFFSPCTVTSSNLAQPSQLWSNPVL